MKRLLVVAVAVVAVLVTFTTSVMATDTFGARLRGFEEVPVISSEGQGFFVGVLNDAENQIDYTLVYFGMESAVTQAHIHVGQPGVNGGIVLFLCTNLGNAPPGPAVPTCPNGPGLNAVTGSLSSASVVPVTAQGISTGEFSEVVDAMKAIVSYVNVHTVGFPGGEIRGQVTH